MNDSVRDRMTRRIRDTVQLRYEPGAREILARGGTLHLNSLEAETAAVAGLSVVQPEIDQLRRRAETAEASVARGKAIHYPITYGTVRHCNVCSSIDGTRRVLWPCPTYRALDQPAKED